MTMKNTQDIKQQQPPAVASSDGLGRAAWNAYKTTVGGKAWNGDPLPTWEEMSADPKKQQLVSAWNEAARAAVHLYTLQQTQKIVASGYAGVMPNGNIVDRRDKPEAVPIPGNTLLNVPKPKAL